MTFGHSLVSAFERLTLPDRTLDASAIALRTASVPRLRQVRVGKEVHGLPAVLVSVTDDSPCTAPPIELASFSYRPQTRCIIFDAEEGTSECDLALLLCRSEDPELQVWFLRTVGALLGEMELPISRPVLDGAVERLVRLFTALGRPPTESVQGLWGELVLIAHARDPLALLRAWHSEPFEIHDFVDGIARVEVKTSMGSRREHHFTLEQLMCPAEVDIAVASMLLQPSPRGYSIADLVAAIEGRIGPGAGLLGKLHDVVGATLGNDWRRATNQRYLVAEALSMLALFDARNVPRVATDIPPEVREVRFIVEMWDVPMLGQAVQSGIPLWAALPTPGVPSGG